jgi:hypothetical protein
VIKILIALMLSLPFLSSGSDNYWENGDNSEYIPPSIASSPGFDNVIYTSAEIDGGPFMYTNVYCSSGVGAEGKGSNQKPQSIPLEKTCSLRLDEASYLIQGGEYQAGYDSARLFVELCPLFNKVTNGFNYTSTANEARSSDNGRYEEYREWLKSVLYLNPSSEYYCADVGAIFNTMFWFDDEHGRHQNGTCAIIKFLLEENKCPDATEYFINAYNATRQSQLKHWRDTVQDSLVTPLDTTLPSLEDLGLGILRGNPNKAVSPATSDQHLGELIATRNPFTDILELKYRLDKSGMVRIDVYDLLGRAVYSEGQGYKAEGEHVLWLQSKAWSSGSYYVRLSSPSGEVKTVKVVKE